MPGAPEALAPAEVVGFVLADLTIILVAARLVGGLAVKVGQPRIVGEIVAAVLIGPTVLGGSLASGAIDAINKPAVAGSGLVGDIYPLQAFGFLSLLGTLTLVFFMFLVGMEFEQRLLRGRERQILVVAIGVVVAPIALGFLVGGILDEPNTWKPAETPSGREVTGLTHALFLGAALAVTAFPVMARVLQEKRMLDTPMGAVGVGAAAVVTPLMFLILAGATASAQGQGVPEAVGTRLVLALGLVLVLFFIVRPALERYLRPRFDPDRGLDDTVFAVLLVGAVLTGLLADRIGIHSLNGGFLFGACVPQIAGLGRAVIERLSQFVVIFLIPVFLAVAGLQTDLKVLQPEHIAGIALFLAAMLLAKWGAGALIGRAVGLNWTEANAVGVLMNCRGLMILVVAIVGKQAGVITEPMQAAFVIGALVTTMMTGPLVGRLLGSKAVEEERERTLSESLSSLPAMTGGRRVLLCVHDEAELEAVVRSARAYAAESPAPQFLLAWLPGLDPYGEYVGAGPQEEAGVLDTTSRRLGLARDALAREGVDVAEVTFQSPEPGCDLLRLGVEWAASEAVSSDEAERRAFADAGIEPRPPSRPPSPASEPANQA